jgi:excisionase family DNA binding protein
MTELTVKEYAAVERVAERTVRRWIEKGAVEVRRTPGGGVRITPDPRLVAVQPTEHPHQR